MSFLINVCILYIVRDWLIDFFFFFFRLSRCSRVCRLLPCFDLRVEAVLLLVATRPADGVDQAVAQLQQADDELQHGQAQQHAQQSHVPLHDVHRLETLRPLLGLQEITGERTGRELSQNERYVKEVTPTWHSTVVSRWD